ncbi:MAG TPA: flagellar hook-basal body complex protein FliE [Verrucomicrobiae bacterium]|jgi:flagellar hook-basal body complex protein FliE|nr:flagellar hook-basal body complex protein FliE [Verrucomicrobiae bacterium]
MLPISNIPQALPIEQFRQIRDAVEAARTSGIDGVPGIGQTPEVLPGQSAGNSFGDLLGKMVQEVNASQNHAAETVSALQSGGNASLHQAVIAMEEASVSFQLMVEVRNKLLESYQELMRMQM